MVGRAVFVGTRGGYTAFAILKHVTSAMEAVFPPPAPARRSINLGREFKDERICSIVTCENAQSYLPKALVGYECRIFS